MALEIQFLPLEIDGLVQCTETHKADGYRFVQMLCVNTDNGVDMQYSFRKDNVIENYTIKGVKKGTKIPSITPQFINAFFFENEAHDLFGVEVEGNLLDFQGAFYSLAEKEPMTIITPAQKEAREKAAKAAAVKAAKAAHDADQSSDKASASADERKGE